MRNDFQKVLYSEPVDFMRTFLASSILSIWWSWCYSPRGKTITPIWKFYRNPCIILSTFKHVLCVISDAAAHHVHVLIDQLTKLVLWLCCICNVQLIGQSDVISECPGILLALNEIACLIYVRTGMSRSTQGKISRQSLWVLNQCTRPLMRPRKRYYQFCATWAQLS